MCNKKRIVSVISMVAVVLLSACGNVDTAAVIVEADHTKIYEMDSDEKSSLVNTETMIDTSSLFSDRDLSGAYHAAECDSIILADAGSTTDSKNVIIDGSIVTITGEGEYLVSGTLSDGMIIIDVEKSEKVQLVLNGVDITSKSSAAIYVKKADKVFVTLADDTKNMLANGGAFVAIDDNHIDAVIFSKDDLTLNGTGALNVTSPAAHGIVSKNELTITDGTYHITAASHGMTGKDSVAIANGKFEITAGKDAIQSQNEADDTAGFVYLANGSYVLRAGSDGISAINEIFIADGTITVEQSKEGLEARLINVSGGEIDIHASDDGLNATDKRAGAVSSKAVEMSEVFNLPEMSEKGVRDARANEWEPDSGSSQNLAEKRKDFQGGMGDAQSDAKIHISGGIIRVNAEGDGVDSNGYLTVSGGALYVAGPSSGKDGALDYGIDAIVSGGVVVAAGQSNMAQNFGAESTQGTILVNTQQQNAAGSEIALLDSSGGMILAWTMEKSYNSVVVSCPKIKDGASYTVKTGDTSTKVLMDGLVYGEGFLFGGGRHGKIDFESGERPEGMPQPPDFRDEEKIRGMKDSSVSERKAGEGR